MQNQQPQIQLLPDAVINKIAAGEVVERPASVLKELLENAVDAGATRIEAELTDGGRRLIAVTDDGCGMNRDNALLSIERHATSKIRGVEDIERIGTLGFRGEALAAVASVSRFTLVTRPAAELTGTEIRISGGSLQDVREAGCPAGTRIEVRNLFFNVPARRKFLRAERTESAQARQLFLVQALAHPEVGLRLVVDEREVYQLPPGGGLAERIALLYSRDFFNRLRPVEWSGGGMTVRGFAGPPDLSRKDRSDQYFFINGRPASAPVLYHAIHQAYHTLLPRGQHPALFLFIELDPSGVDVNVHPTKKEVRFRQPSELRDAVIAALRKALELPAATRPAPERERFPGVPPVSFAGASDKIRQIAARELFPDPGISVKGGSAGSSPVAVEKPSSPAEPVSVPGVAPAGAESWAGCRVLGQAGGLFVVLEAGDGLMLMDPHAAHERVLYEKFMRDVQRNRVRTQGLLAPEVFSLPPNDAETARRHLGLLTEMGFGISEFGGDAFLVDALPVYLQFGRAEELVAEAVRSLEAGGRRGGTETQARERVAQAACKAAVKAHDALSLPEIEQLVRDLARAEMPYTCPHGRPTLIFMGWQELRRKFGRE